MTIREQIKQAGLTENEAKVYEALLEMGARPAGIISRKTGLHRRVIYDVTDRLIKKGLIGYIMENGRKIFSASNPERFLEIIDKERQQIQEILPIMLAEYNQTKDKQREDTLFFRGKEGLKSVFEDQLSTASYSPSQQNKNTTMKNANREKKEILIIGASPLAYEMLEYYFVWFDKKRIAKKIKTKIIFNQLTKKKVPLSEIRYFPENYSSPLAINIYGEKVAIILWSKENPFAIVIKNKEISQGYRKHFEMMWKASKTL